MSDELFHRDAFVQVEGLRVQGLRLQFKVQKSLEEHPNTLDLVITNLSEATRSRMKKKHARVLLLAGYRGAVAQVFSGDARTVDHVRKGAEWETHIKCGDGERAWVYSRVSESFAPGTTLDRVVTTVSRAFGAEVDWSQAPESLATLQKKQCVSGFSASGRASKELSRVVKGAGLEWSIQDGKLQLLPKGGVLSGRALVLSSESGLVESPEHGAPKKEGGPSVLKAKSLLQPGLRPGSRVDLKTKSFKGPYRVEKVTHNGDTHGQNWHTEMELVAA